MTSPEGGFSPSGIPFGHSGRNREVSPFGRFKEGSGEGNRNPSPGALSPISGASEMGPPEAVTILYKQRANPYHL